MLYNLTNLINKLEPAEIRNFKLHITRYNYKNQEKKITLLFDAIKKDKADEYDDALIKKILPKGKKNAFFQLKNRLTEEIENSLLHLHRNKSEEIESSKNLQLYEIFLHKSDYHRANIYLKKAEKIALKLENYDSLISIYKKYIQVARYLNVSPEKYIIQQNKFQELATSINQSEQYISSIEYHLKNTNFSGKDNEVINELEKISQSLQLNELTKNSVRTRLSVNQCVRQTLLQRKEFLALADYMINAFGEFVNEQLFGKNNHEEKIIQLSWIVNSLLKSKRLRTVPKYTEQLYKALEEHNRLLYDKYIWLYYQSKVMELTFLGKNMEAIDLLLELREKETIPYNSTIFIFVYMNLIGLYFSAKKYDECLEVLADVIVDNKFKTMSADRKLNIQLLELIIHTEIDDIEYAHLKSKEIKRKYNTLLKEEAYQTEREFLKMVVTILKKPNAFSDKAFIETAEHFIHHTDYEPGSNAFIDYGVWLQSKIENKDYYELIFAKF